MAAYYNEIEPFAAAWLRNLIAAGHIAPGDVDERDIRDIKPSELAGYTQCHFFAGIGGWSLALRLAGGLPHERQRWRDRFSRSTLGRPRRRVRLRLARRAVLERSHRGQVTRSPSPR